MCDLMEEQTAWCVRDDVQSDLTFSETDALAEVDEILDEIPGWDW